MWVARCSEANAGRLCEKKSGRKEGEGEDFNTGLFGK